MNGYSKKKYVRKLHNEVMVLRRKVLKFLISPCHILDFLEAELFEKKRDEIIIRRQYDTSPNPEYNPHLCFEVIVKFYSSKTETKN